jgi:hypothetical protein
MWILELAMRWITIATLAVSAYADCCGNSVAVVASVFGAATVRRHGSNKKGAVARLDWLSDGMTIEIGKQSQVVLILLDGHRYELNDGAQATLTGGGAPKIMGSVRELPALPPIPRSAPILADSATTSGAYRIRGATEMRDLYPRAGTVVMADRITLRFSAVPEATSYRVAIEDGGGDRLWNISTESTEVSVPAGTIKEAATAAKKRLSASIRRRSESTGLRRSVNSTRKPPRADARFDLIMRTS